MQSILVIGVGRFGKHLAKTMLDLGNDIVIVDKNEEKVEALNSIFPDSFIGDCQNEGVLRSLGINNFDICFVCTGKDFQASLEITSLLKELGAKKVVSVAKRDRQANLLKKIGADDTIYPEREIAEKTGIIILTDSDSTGFRLRHFLSSAVFSALYFSMSSYILGREVFAKSFMKPSNSGSNSFSIHGRS